MKEIKGNLWNYYGQGNFVICITTNGTVKKDGSCVMGRGCAAEAKKRFPQLPYALGEAIKHFGNKVNRLGQGELLSFPVKHNWWENADPKLIKASADQLNAMATEYPALTIILPRPGCGNGHLNWTDVKPLLEFLPDNVWVIDFS